MEENIFSTPEVPSRLRFRNYQLVGMIFLFSIPLLAMTGLFSVKDKKIQTTKKNIEIKVDFNSRIRIGQTMKFNVSLNNISDSKIPSVEIDFAEDYVVQFEKVRSSPEMASKTGISLADLGPGEMKTAFIEMKAIEFGNHSGKLSVSSADEKLFETTLDTLILP